MGQVKAPEKIYLVIDPVWGSMSVNYNRNDTNNIEYVRTDAFIEETVNWLINNTDITPTGIKNYRKAMKGE